MLFLFILSNDLLPVSFLGNSAKVYCTETKPLIVSIAKSLDDAKKFKSILEQYSEIKFQSSPCQDTQNFQIFGYQKTSEGTVYKYAPKNQLCKIYLIYLASTCQDLAYLDNQFTKFSQIITHCEKLELLSPFKTRSYMRHPAKNSDENSIITLSFQNFYENLSFKAQKIAYDKTNWMKQKREEALDACAKNSSVSPVPLTIKLFPILLKPFLPIGTTWPEILEKKTHEALQEIKAKYPTLKVGMLNFANALFPGGGFLGCGSAQEEDLCDLASALFISLYCTPYYPFKPAEILYTQNVIFGKNSADVITAALPNFRRIQETSKNVIPEAYGEGSKYYLPAGTNPPKNLGENKEYTELLLDTWRHILLAGRNCDVLVLGAIGCGAFGNNPYPVAQALYEVGVKGKLFVFYKKIYLAICKNEENLRVFTEVFKKDDAVSH